MDAAATHVAAGSAASGEDIDAGTRPGWHALSPHETARRLRTDAGVGLGVADVRERRSRYGVNLLPEPPPRPLWRIYLRQFASPLVLILFAAAALAVALGHHADAGVILAVVAANAIVGLLQEGRAERSMAALRRLSEVHVRVLRGGSEAVIAAADLVPGDVMLLAAGDAIAADARVLEQAQLQAAEASLTGESVPVSKTTVALAQATALADRRNMVFSGTHVTAGRGIAVVVATGAHTEIGRIARLTASAQEPSTPLQQRIARFGQTLVAAAFGLFVTVVLLGLWRELPLSDVLMVAISQMVSMVPEGLPVAMTIALAVGMQRMARQGVIVRRLAAVETLGSTTVICSDKTGTLTRNEMTVAQLWLPPRSGEAAIRIQVAGIGYAPEGLLSIDGTPLEGSPAPLAPLLEAAVLCNDARLLPPREAKGWQVAGDPTEGALLVLALKAGVEPQALRAQATRVDELPFDSDAKLMATLVRLPDAARRIFVKGAPEAVLSLCGGEPAQILEAARLAAEGMSSQALRVLAFAEVGGGDLDAEAGFAALAGRCRLLGLAGQIDPPRHEAHRAVVDCRAAGIRPVMVTGDHKLTGLAIAQALGIARADDLAVDGEELERMGEAELRERLPDIAVFARVHPAQKLRIVEALQACGEVVAMTGDGVNDAPALARADIGVAMGITGTEVAKNAAGVVATDDNFATIVSGVEQGRVVYGNLKKVILFLFATSADEIALLLLALLAGYPLPLAAVQILWINIVTEGTLTVNLVMEPADGNEMRRPPLSRGEPLLDVELLRRLALMAASTVLVCFAWFTWRLASEADTDAVRTEVFTLLAMCQWFNVLNCQSATRTSLGTALLHNRWLLGGLMLSVVLQLAVLYVPLLNSMLHTTPLPGSMLLLLAGLASLVLWPEELRKFFDRRSRTHLAVTPATT